MSYRGTVGEVVESRRGDLEISSFEWRIPDFPSLAGEGGDWYESPPFDAYGGKWCFQIYPKGLWQTPPSNRVSLYLWRVDGGLPQTLDVRLGIRGAGGVENKRERRQEFSRDDRACFWFQFCSRLELSEQKSVLMPGNVLILSLDVKSVVPKVDRGTEELKESLKTLLSGKVSDVIVKVKGKEFPAHRLILQARSAVFEAMFCHDMVEKQSGIVNMEDCDPETFPDFLEHVYTGSVEMISTGNVFSLFAASDKYDLKTLKKACAEFVKNNLTVTSFCNAITLAITHDEKELTELATEFFCSHSLEICKTAEWQVFLMENTIVGNELIIKAFSK